MRSGDQLSGNFVAQAAQVECMNAVGGSGGILGVDQNVKRVAGQIDDWSGVDADGVASSQVLEVEISWGGAPPRHGDAAQSSSSLRYTHVVCNREKLFRTAPANAGRDLCKFLQHSVEMLLRNAFCNGDAIVSF